MSSCFPIDDRNKKTWLWKSPTSSKLKVWRLCLLSHANFRYNSLFWIHREWRSLSKAGAVNFMYHLWNCHRGHVLCSVLLQKQVRPFLSSVKRLLLRGSTLSFFKFSVWALGRRILCKWAHQTSLNDWIFCSLWWVCTAWAYMHVCGSSLMHIVIILLCDHEHSVFFAFFECLPKLKAQHQPVTKGLTLLKREITAIHVTFYGKKK